MQLKAIGFWKSDDEPKLPHPEIFVGEYEPEEKRRIVSYLDSGNSYIEYLGFSHCRFGCPPSLKMGTSDFTDGVWVWPQGLSHYVIVHNVLLPTEFIQHAKSNFWKVPPIVGAFYDGYNFDFWCGLAQNV